MSPQEAQREIRLQEWESMVKARLESGMTVKAWCEATGISRDGYFYRLRQIRKAAIARQNQSDGEQNGLPTLMKVDIERSAINNVTNQSIKLLYGECTLEIAEGSTAEAIAEILKAIRLSAV